MMSLVLESRRRWAAAVLAVGIVATEADAQYLPIRELDSNGLFQNGSAHQIAGDFVIGSGEIAPGVPVPVLWGPTGPTLLPLLPGIVSGFPTGVNTSGTAIGFGWDSNRANYIPHLWSGGVAIDLNSLLPSGSGVSVFLPLDIDESGRILFDGEDYWTHSIHAFLFENGQLTDLGALDATHTSSAYSMNDHGLAVGHSNVAWEMHACTFENGVATDLHPLVANGAVASVAGKVNRHGSIVGFAQYGRYPFQPVDQRAFFWDGTQAFDLDASAPAGWDSFAHSINDFGLILGGAVDPVTLKGMVCSWQDGVLTDLNTLVDPALGWVLTQANDVDDRGRIVGSGTLNGVTSAFIIEPTCLGTFTIFGTGCPGTNGVEPRLLGAGCPAPDLDFAITVDDGVANSLGFLVLGTGTNVFPIKPGCDLQVLPLSPPILPFVLDGWGELWIEENLPSGTPTFDLNLQVLFLDPGAAHGISSSKPLALHFE